MENRRVREKKRHSAPRHRAVREGVSAETTFPRSTRVRILQEYLSFCLRELSFCLFHLDKKFTYLKKTRLDEAVENPRAEGSLSIVMVYARNLRKFRKHFRLFAMKHEPRITFRIAKRGRKTWGMAVVEFHHDNDRRRAKRMYICAITRMTRKVGAVECARTKGGQGREEEHAEKKSPTKGGREEDE